MTTVGDDFPREQARVREVLDVYRSLGPNGVLGAMAISAALERADRAAIAGDIVEILQSYRELKEIE